MFGVIKSIFLRLFFGHHYDYQHALEKYGYALTHPVSDLKRLSLVLPYLLVKTIHLKVAAILTLDPKTRRYLIHAADGENCEIDGQSLDANSPLIQHLASHNKELALGEAGSLSAEMKKLGAVLIIPAISPSKGELLFAAALGPRLFGETYSHEDIRFLKGFIHQIVINLEHPAAG